MSQHFLLSSKARTISVKKIASMSEKDCFEYFKSIRWSSNRGNPVCPTCGFVGVATGVIPFVLLAEAHRLITL